MADQPDANAERPRFFTRRVVIAFSVVGFFFLLGLVWLALTLAAHAAVEGELAKIRSRGEPVILDDIIPALVPDHENVAVALASAFAELSRVTVKLNKMWPSTGWTALDPAKAGHLERIRQLTDVSSKAVELARKALERPKCRFDLDYSAGEDMFLAHLSRLRSFCRLLEGRALGYAAGGRSEDAVGEVVTILALARTVEDEPVSASTFYMFGMVRSGLSALQRVARLVALDDRARKKLISELAAFDFRRSATQAMMCARVSQLDAIDRILDGTHGWVIVPGPWQQRFVRPLIFHYVRDKAKYLRRKAEHIEATRLPPWKAVRRFPQPGLGKIECHPSFRAPFTSGMLSGTGYRFAVRVTAHRDVAVIGLACGLHHSKHGRYPDKLDDLAPEFLPAVPPDPFTGKPFGYARRGEGFVVYGVGENLKDQGGAGDDIVWEGGAAKRAPSARPRRASSRGSSK